MNSRQVSSYPQNFVGQYLNLIKLLCHKMRNNALTVQNSIYFHFVLGIKKAPTEAGASLGLSVDLRGKARAGQPLDPRGPGLAHGSHG